VCLRVEPAKKSPKIMPQRFELRHYFMSNIALHICAKIFMHFWENMACKAEQLYQNRYFLGKNKGLSTFSTEFCTM
jgi:hypothetical protein